MCWANVGRSPPAHTALLQLAFEDKADVICVQEPFTCAGSRTSTHPAYQHYSPVATWDQSTDSERPRVMTYIRKTNLIKAEQGGQGQAESRDLLWVVVNGLHILNAYRQPQTPEVIDYITQMTPPPRCLIGGDFNARHQTFEPGTVSSHRGAELARWASRAGMDFIGQPGQPTHRAGHVLDLTFSNVPFAITAVAEDLQCGSDHFTQITTVPSNPNRNAGLEQYRHKVSEAALPKFAGLVEVGLQGMRQLNSNPDTTELEDTITQLTGILTQAMETAGKPDRGEGRAAPWWTDECQQAHRDHIRARKNPGTSSDSTAAETRAFLTVVRRAKRQYWRKTIDELKDDRDLFRVVAWHKLEPNNQDPPLVHNGRTITDTAEKAEALREAILHRYTAEDDLPEAPSPDTISSRPLPWDSHISMEEVERNTIGIPSTSPGTDRITVRLLKACWTHVKGTLRWIYQQCLRLNHFPSNWKLAEVAMAPKVGKKDKTSTRSWRPIALLSCIGKGLERIAARRLAWTAMKNELLSPQHGGALPKRAASDLAAAFTHDTEVAWNLGKHVTMVTLDVQGAFDALLKNRLLHRMAAQGWPLGTLKFVESFLTNRRVQVRLGRETTPSHPVECGTPQGSPLSPVLYTLYLAEMLNQDQRLRFGYADDICLYRATHSLSENVRLLAEDVRQITGYGNDNKIAFAPEKIEMIHLTRQRGNDAPPCEVNEHLTITPTVSHNSDQPALRWLGVWFDRKLTFRKHVATRVAKAGRVAHHIRSLAKTTCGPPASSLRKAVITCVLPSLMYGTECWYGGRTKPPRLNRTSREVTEVSARVGWHIAAIDRAIATAARGILPAWRTTPIAILFRDSGIPSAEVALEEAKLRFALRLRTVDDRHPLTARTVTPIIPRGRGAGTQRPKTKVQRIGALLPEVPRPILAPPHYSPGCREDPTGGLSKEEAAKAFKDWWAQLPPNTVTIFSDGSEQIVEGAKRVTYGYAIYQGGRLLDEGKGSISPQSHVFDAEAVGAWKGLQHTMNRSDLRLQRIWMCIDSTSVIQCLMGNASPTSQWAFLLCQEVMDTWDVSIRWSPGHTGIEGNERADALADAEAKNPTQPTGTAALPTISGIRTVARQLLRGSMISWWKNRAAKLSQWYRDWGLQYDIKAPRELDLTRPVLARLIALRTMHGDFEWYHRKFNHPDANLKCSCGKAKWPSHIIHCRKTVRLFGQWPQRPHWPPCDRKEGMDYLRKILQEPEDFNTLLQITGFYSSICPR